MQHYNPIVRSFNRLRVELMRIGVPRHHVCPEMPLDLLIPGEQRRQVWRRLRQAGLEVPSLEFSTRDITLNALMALKTALSLALASKAWLALLSFAPLGLLAGFARRSRAICYPLGITTVGELVLYLTRFADHAHSGYHWTANEISTKVRLVLAESLNLTLEKVQPESKLYDFASWFD